MPRELMEKPMVQVSSATSQQKWKYKSYKVYIASQENETQWYNVRLDDMTSVLAVRKITHCPEQTPKALQPLFL